MKKVISNCGDWDGPYWYYYDDQRMIETRNGSDHVLRQHVWGLSYIDELCQIGINQDPGKATSGQYLENKCERFFWPCQEANYNLLGVVSGTGLLVERYEYTPGVYPDSVGGRRTVFSRNWLLADMDADGLVGTADLGILSGNWGLTDIPDSRADLRRLGWAGGQGGAIGLF